MLAHSVDGFSDTKNSFLLQGCILRVQDVRKISLPHNLGSVSDRFRIQGGEAYRVVWTTYLGDPAASGLFLARVRLRKSKAMLVL